MSLLDLVPGLVKSVAGPLVFQNSTLVSRGTPTPDGRGGLTYADTKQVIKSLILSEDQDDQGSGTQSRQEYEIIIALDGLQGDISAESYIAHGGVAYNVVDVTVDPAGATATVTAHRAGLATGEGASLSLILDSASGGFGVNDGSSRAAIAAALGAISGGPTVAVAISAEVAQTLQEVTTGVTIVQPADLDLTVAQQLADMGQSISFAVLDARSAQVAATLDGIQTTVTVLVPIEVTLSGSLDSLTTDLDTVTVQPADASVSQTLGAIGQSVTLQALSTTSLSRVLSTIVFDVDVDVGNFFGVGDNLNPIIQGSNSITVANDTSVSQTLAPLSATVDVSVATPSSNETETDALLARMTVAPSSTREAVINNTIKDLKDAGLWNKLDLLYVFAAHDAQASLLNWKGASFNATNYDSTFSADWGYGETTGNSPDSPPGLGTGWNSQSDAVQFTDNSMHIGVWGKAHAGREYFKMGSIEMQCGGTVTTGDNIINFGGNSDTTDANTNSLDGYKLMSANYNAGGDDIGRFYHNGAEAAGSPPTITSGFIENAEMQLITRFNSSGNAGVRIFHLGSELSAAEAAQMYSILGNYLTFNTDEFETDQLINEMSVAPSTARRDTINTLIKTMKDEGIWDKLGWFSIVGHNTDASLKNWIVPTETLTAENGSPVVADQYFDAQGATGNGGFTAGLADDGGAALGDMTFGAYFVKLDESGNTRCSRIRDNQTFFRSDFSSPIMKCTGGTQHPNTYASRVVNDPYHMCMVHRGTGAADREGYYNGASFNTEDGAGGSLSLTSTVDLLGTVSKNGDERYFCGYYGRALTTAQVTAMYDAVEAYKAAL